VTSEAWDVVVVPFPFSERPGSRRRPAVVLSKPSLNKAGHTIMAMITTSARSPWPGDTEIGDLAAAGLRVDCRVRLKLFTLDNRLILKTIGRLSPADRKVATTQVRKHLG